MNHTGGSTQTEASIDRAGETWFADVSQVASDPYLRWAADTRFRDYSTRGGECDRIPNTDRIVVAIELAEDKTIHDLNRALKPADSESHGKIPDAYLRANARYLTCALMPSAFKGTVWESIAHHIRRLNLAVDLLPQRPLPRVTGSINDKTGTWETGGNPEANTNVVVGIIDTYFAFAHRDLRDSNGNTRIAALWDQDSQPALGSLPGRVPPEFDYGREVNRAGLHEYLDGFQVNAGLRKSLNEDACYDACNYLELRARFAHGTAVAGMIAGPVPMLDRVRKEAGQVPSYSQKTKSGERSLEYGGETESDLVLVQLPRDAVQDGAGHGLVAHVMDGLRYIVSRAKKAKCIVANLSFAYQTGPHDGTSMLEEAIDDFVQECQDRGIDLKVVLPTGNTFLERCHARFNLQKDRNKTLTLALPPGNEVSTFVEIWLPPGDKPTITLVAPDGKRHDNVMWSENGVRGGGDRRMALIAIAQTAVFSRNAAGVQFSAAPAGKWKIKIKSKTRAKDVRAWIAFNQQNSGAKLRGRQARFVDKEWDPERFLRPGLLDTNPRSAVKRLGTISGIANGTKSIVVAGTLRRGRRSETPRQSQPTDPKLRSGEHAFYSGARSSDGVSPNRFISAPCEESWALAGVPVAGSRSGSIVRARGTSFSTPQVARYLADMSRSGAHVQTLIGPGFSANALTGEGTFESDDV